MVVTIVGAEPDVTVGERGVGVQLGRLGMV
jgi:hypothetical protein